MGGLICNDGGHIFLAFSGPICNNSEIDVNFVALKIGLNSN